MPFDFLGAFKRLPKYRFSLTSAVVVTAGVWVWGCQSAVAANALDAIKQSIQAGQLDQAFKLVQQERQLSPKDVQVQFLEAVILAQQGQHDRAIEAFRKITEVHPELPEPYNNLGVLYAAKGRLDEARAAFEKAILTHASYSAAHKNLADVQAQLARQAYAKALQVDPKVKAATPQLTLLGAITTERTDITKIPGPAVKPAAMPAVTPPMSTPAVTPSPAQSDKSTEEQERTSVREASKLAAKEDAKEAQKQAQKEASKALAEKQKEQSAEAESIKLALQTWARNWSQKDTKKYFASYANNFDPPDNMSRAKWEAERELRITSKKKIQVALSNFKIDINGNKAKVTFSQIYESDNFKGNSRKSMELTKQGGRWMITRETVN
jgi:tetratricopeptide (TPR) repeat protein